MCVLCRNSCNVVIDTAHIVQPPVIYLMGPTASGKTGMALEICRYFPVEIISVDSAMVYRGLDIGTAKPAADVLRTAPHHLIDICDPVETYSAARFRNDAMDAINSIRNAGRTPLLVGGTGLYFRALEKGLSVLPSADAGIRRQIEEDAAVTGWKAQHEKLARIDPTAAARIHPNDPQRIQRSLEVYYLTGKTLTDHYRNNRLPQSPWTPHKLVISPGKRQVLHERIERRFHEMLAAGFMQEVEGLYRRPELHPGLPAMKLVGYRQAWKYLGGELDYQQMIAQAVVATRQLAKRQLTWLRKEANCSRLDTETPGYKDNLLKIIENIAENPV